MRSEIGEWQTGMTQAQRGAARALLERVRETDRRGPVDSDIPAADGSVLLATAAGQVIGLAWYHGSDPAELFVDPPHRAQGLGRRLADRILATGRGIWAHGTLPAASAVAAAAGAHPVRTLLQMRRQLGVPLPVELPAHVAIRTLRPGVDDAAFLAVNARAFAWHPEQGRLDQAGFDEEKSASWFDPDGFFLAVSPGVGGATDVAGAGTADAGTDDASQVLGFHWTKVHAADPTPRVGTPAEAGPVGEVYVIGVDPHSPIRHLGAPLTAAGLNYLAARGLDEVLLYVEDDNEPALRLYERLGFDRYAADTVYAT